LASLLVSLAVSVIRVSNDLPAVPVLADSGGVLMQVHVLCEAREGTRLRKFSGDSRGGRQPIYNPLVHAGGLFFFRKVEVVNYAAAC